MWATNCQGRRPHENTLHATVTNIKYGRSHFLNAFSIVSYIYAAKHYPGYFNGASWISRTSILPLLLKASLTTPMIHIDDAYITGMLPKEVGIIPRNIRLMTVYEENHGPCITKQRVSQNNFWVQKAI